MEFACQVALLFKTRGLSTSRSNCIRSEKSSCRVYDEERGASSTVEEKEKKNIIGGDPKKREELRARRSLRAPVEGAPLAPETLRRGGLLQEDPAAAGLLVVEDAVPRRNV